ncbi:MAG: ATP-dependent RNA helicase DeaD [Paracoccaceae bacterium]|jgi:ATP-dependent RNA helicase DeaD
MTDFEGVVPALGAALTNRNYETLTPVQQEVLAPELKDADMLVSAQTGSGKTVAFGLALAPTLLGEAERFHHTKAPRALIVAPTRELALQVMRELEWLYAETGAAFASCVGGMDMRTERQILGRGVHIVVGTPGRLRDHIERRSLDMRTLQAVVLDEADEMLDLGFREDLEFILDAAPPERRTMMFSATVPRMIANLAKKYQNNAVRVKTSAEQQQHVDIEYRALNVANHERENAIINVLRYYEAKSAIVFCATRMGVNRMTSRFTNRGFSVVALSGELSQAQRTHALQAMRDGRARVCIATDVAARGLDLPNLELVIHADLPENSQGLLHRSGRTGRAGRKGTSVLIVPHNRRKRTERLFYDAHIDAEWANPPSVEEVTERDDARLLEDPVLVDAIKDDEKAFVTEILARHSAEQVAAAFVRQYRAGQSAPEDLHDNAPPSERDDRGGARRGEGRGGERGRDSDRGRDNQRERPRRDDFEGGIWFSLSVGHKETAEPRWLLPMLYRVGNVAKGGIGAIKVYNSESHVEIAPDSVDKFVASLGPDGVIEKGIVVKRLDGPPPEIKEKRESFAKKKRFGDSSSGPRGRSDRGDRGDRPSRSPVDATPYSGDDKPWDKPKAKRDDDSGAGVRARPGKRDWEKPGGKSSDSHGGSRADSGGENRAEGYRGRPGKPDRKDSDGYESKPAHAKPKAKNPGKYARKARAEGAGEGGPDRSAGSAAERPTLKSKKAYKPGKSNFKKKGGKPRGGASDGFSPRKRKTT